MQGILAWADAHRARTGEWPDRESGPIPECPGSTWRAVQTALTCGGRGLPGGSSISRLLVERRAIRHRFDPPDLTILQILAWAEAFLTRTGQWPSARSGPIHEAPGESWREIEGALRTGGRGLTGGVSLRRLRDPAKLDQSAQAIATCGRSAPQNTGPTRLPAGQPPAYRRAKLRTLFMARCPAADKKTGHT